MVPTPFKVAFGIFIYGTATYGGYHYYRIQKMPLPDSHRPELQVNMENVYEDRERDYDKDIDWDEWMLGIGNLRKNVFASAEVKGRVLEVASGTGRNLEYYIPKNIDHLILSEQSKSMLEKALIRFRAYRTKYDGQAARVEFKLIDGHKLPFEDQSFDTVVQSFGICSLHDPVAALKEMQRVLKKGGSMLLLEHGRSHYQWLNEALDKTAHAHSQTWGCWWNRDVLTIVNEAGLQIESVERHHLGTTYIVKCLK